MGFHAAKSGASRAGSGPLTVNHEPRRRSSPAADGVAMVFAASVLLTAVWGQRAVMFRSQQHLYLVLGIPLVFALGARLLRGVDTSGAGAGAMVAFVLASRDLRLLWVLLVVFAVTLASTRAGSSRKRQLRMAEAEGGRSASQVMSNLGVAALVLAVPSFPSGAVLALAALAEAAADTTSSEIGTAFSGKIVLVTTGKAVSAGTDGGISLSGTLAGILAAAITAAAAFGLGLVGLGAAVAITGAGLAGMLVDSLLGATLEQRGYLDNNLVNLSGTTAAALLMWCVTVTGGP